MSNYSNILQYKLLILSGLQTNILEQWTQHLIW